MNYKCRMTAPKGPPERVILYRYRESPYVREARTDDKMEEHAYLLESAVLSERAAHEKKVGELEERLVHLTDDTGETWESQCLRARAEVARLREALELLSSGIYHGREVVDLAERALAPPPAIASSPARLDADRMSKPLTEIRGVVVPRDKLCVHQPDAYVYRETTSPEYLGADLMPTPGVNPGTFSTAPEFALPAPMPSKVIPCPDCAKTGRAK